MQPSLVDDAAQAAKDAIDAATTNADVATECGKGETAIAAVNPVRGTLSQKAKAEVDKAADAKKAAIEADNKRKDAAIASRRCRAAAKDAIDAATTNADVATEQARAGETAINAVNPVADAKPKLKRRLIKQQMPRRPQSKPTTPTAKRKMQRSLVNDAAQNRHDAIDAATTNADVALEQGKGETAINAVNPVADAKPKAKAKSIKQLTLRKQPSKRTTPNP